MGSIRIIKTDCTDPYANLAAEEYLTMNAEDGVMTLFLWQNARTVVIGKNQNPWSECDVEAIKRDGISLARRMSGGGAVYHDMGNLNFTFIAKDGLFDIDRQTDVILLACRLMGVNAVKTGRKGAAKVFVFNCLHIHFAPSCLITGFTLLKSITKGYISPSLVLG